MPDKLTPVEKLRVSSYTADPSAVAVGSFFNGLDIDNQIDFKLYQHKKRTNEMVIHGETEFLDYDGSTEQDAMDVKYCLAVYDPAHRSVDLFDETPLLTSTISSKKRKLHSGPRVKQTNVRHNIKRNLLGETFGTKKAKKAITDLEKNRIDSELLESNQLDIMDSLNKSTAVLPSREELTEKIQQERPIPKFDAEAKNVDDIYPLENLIAKKLFQFIQIDSFLKEEPKEIIEQLPCNSAFISKKVEVLSKDQTHNKKQQFQIIYYLSLLLGVYNNRRLHNKEKLSEALNQPSDYLLDEILTNFTVSKTGSFGRSKDRAFVIDPASEDKLLCYILVLILKLNNYMIEVSPLSAELSLKPSKLASLLKAIGCQLKNCTQSQAEIFGISKSLASSYKIATLKVPFKIPEVSSRGRRS